jgi:maleate cis-trans isomerase
MYTRLLTPVLSPRRLDACQGAALLTRLDGKLPAIHASIVPDSAGAYGDQRRGACYATSVYGWRARVGLIVPSVNSCTEPQFRMMAPDGVAFYATRLALRGGGGRAELLAMAEHVEDAAALLNDLDPALILFHCTAASLAGGVGYDQTIRERIEARTGRPAAATATGIVQALRAVGTERLALITPYPPATNAIEVEFLAGHGFEVVTNVALGLESGADFVRLSPEDWLDVVRSADLARADAIFVSCTNIRVIEAIERMELEHRRPVITSNQAGVWYVLRRLGIEEPVAGYGRLLREPVPAFA